MTLSAAARIAAFALLATASAYAAPLHVTVVTPDGKPLADAVVTAPAAGSPQITFPWKMKVSQQNRQFDPFVLIAPVGATVEFPNLDRFRHHVYSFSKGNKFELELFGREERRTATFKNAGTVAIGCNIHDEMVAYIRVVDTPHAAKTDAAGEAVIANAPNGKTTITVWHPFARSKDQLTTADVQISDGAPVRVTVTVNIAPQRTS